ncbi:MAG: HDOD domain-containing protein [Armatimonadetes bacterium]|nr:HDOD domain-containing protein [Armatimonadota bacterium]
MSLHSGPTKTYQQLAGLFATASTLPQLPGAAIRLIQLLDDDNATGAEVERIIIGDPALTAAVLRAASSALYGGSGDITTVRGAVTRLGFRSVQAVAVSLGVQALMANTAAGSSFDRSRFAKHSLFVGFFARYLYACKFAKEPFQSKWGRDEVFAAGVLHDLGVGLLASVDLATFERVADFSKNEQIPFQDAFFTIYEKPITELAGFACETWGLPPMFREFILNYEKPFETQEAIAYSCVNFADEIANLNDHALEGWRVERIGNEPVAELVGLPEEDVPEIVMLVSRHTAAYVPANAA